MSPEWLSATDAAVCALLVPLAVWILLSGLDDLIVDVTGLLAYFRARGRGRPPRREVMSAEQCRIAIFIPCWHEHEVIAEMVERNRSRIQYGRCEFFIGVYPNDLQTVAEVRRLAERFRDVHLALSSHDGPTSKADCLNEIYQRMMSYEMAAGIRFDVIVTHDAEDVVHSDALHWINWYSREYDMVQIPVLPLPTPFWKWTHGVYCDEFAEYQARDMPARQFMGAFVPSNGVGTGFRREALEELAAAERNRIFEPVCLTEDYENGLRLKLRGARQIFVPMGSQGVVTREYFPQKFRAAVRQRTRWVTGIALQTWERHGWRGGFAVRYWLWRDRKGLIGNPASLLANLIFVYGSVTWTAALVNGWEWGLSRQAAGMTPLISIASAIGLYRILYRAVCVTPHFGLGFALLAPIRIAMANCINSMATVSAVYRFTSAKMKREPLRWVKTDHEYLSSSALLRDRRRIGEILVENGCIDQRRLEMALASQPAERRIGEHLIALGWLTEEDLYEALSLQSGVPREWIDPGGVLPQTARALPSRVTRECRVIPVRVEEGRLYLAGPEAPSEETERAVRRVTSLEPRFSLVTPSNFEELAESLL